MTLVIMAAGLGSRFGGVKQLAHLGPSGEILIDYSVADAVKAGYDHLVFVVRQAIVDDFNEVIGNRTKEACEKLGVRFDVAIQDLNDLPEGFTLPEGRTKPWGTCHAVLAAAKYIDDSFAVLNADDFYGSGVFKKAYDYMVRPERKSNEMCLIGFKLKNTLSENGTVTRAICKADENDILTDIVETKDIMPDGSAEGVQIPMDALVSMNFWGLDKSILDMFREGFVEFLKNIKPGDLKAEFLLPTYIGDLVKAGKIKVKVLDTPDRWFGVTYKEDAPQAQKRLKELVEAGVYASPLKLIKG